MDKDSCFDNVDVSKGSSAPMDQALVRLNETMAKITTECTTGASVMLCETMQHHFFKELDQTFTTFVLLKSMNPCIQ
jgi:hypothetical protein